MEVRIRRSVRRVRGISARLVDGVMLVQAPAAMSDAELAPHIASLQRRLEKRLLKRTLSDADLEERAKMLNERHFGGALRWNTIAWVTNQSTRWGSCTPDTATIRLSHVLQEFPRWVLDAVIVHELAHLKVPGHGPKFWALANRYPLMERARGYLIAKSGRDDDEGECAPAL